MRERSGSGRRMAPAGMTRTTSSGSTRTSHRTDHGKLENGASQQTSCAAAAGTAGGELRDAVALKERGMKHHGHVELDQAVGQGVVPDWDLPSVVVYAAGFMV